MENWLKTLYLFQDWRLRSRALYKLEDALRSTENLAAVQPYLDSLLRTLLSSERHPDVCEDKRRILVNLISRLPLENLENRTGQIVMGLCRQGGATGNSVAKALMQRLPPAAIVLRLLSDEFLSARSSKVRLFPQDNRVDELQKIHQTNTLSLCHVGKGPELFLFRHWLRGRKSPL